MESAAPSTFKTYEANAYDETIHGKVFLGIVLITISEAQIDLNKCTNKLSLEELTEVKDESSLDAFGFPLFEYADINLSEAEQSVMQPSMNEANNNLPSF